MNVTSQEYSFSPEKNEYPKLEVFSDGDIIIHIGEYYYERICLDKDDVVKLYQLLDRMFHS